MTPSKFVIQKRNYLEKREEDGEKKNKKMMMMC